MIVETTHEAIQVARGWARMGNDDGPLAGLNIVRWYSRAAT
jgi:hypothetical protein